MKNSWQQIPVGIKMNFAMVLLLLAIFFFLGHHHYFFSAPQGLHFIRQVDSVSFVYGYFNHGFHFFEPRIYYLESTDGKAACDFPIVYYFTALIFKFFGEHMFLLKIMHALITYTGVFYLFRLIHDLLKDFVFSILVILLLFTSTVFNYYSFNYLPDTAALGFVFMGLYFINRFRTQNNPKNLWWAFVYFTLGGLLKVTYFIYPMALIVLTIFGLIFHKNQKIEKPKWIKIVLFGLVSVLLVVSWNMYILWYNHLNNSIFFNTQPLPIWDLSKNQIETIWEHVTGFWYSKYFAVSTFHVLWALIAAQLIRIKKLNRTISFFIFLCFLGFLSYFLLFYRQFQHHDYYSMVGIPLILLLLTNGILAFQSISQNRILIRIVQLILLLVAISGINYSRMKLPERFETVTDDYDRASRLIQKNKKSIDKLNLPKEAKIIVAPEERHNGSFLFLNRPGWIITYENQIDTIKINQYKGYGATYFVLTKANHEKQILLDSLGKNVLREQDLFIYKLK